MVVAACTGESRSIPTTTDATQSLAPVAATNNGTYRWQTVPVGAGGYVTGLIVVGSGASAQWYSRTDVGGAYRYDLSHRRWVQLLTAHGTPDAQPGDSISVASVAAAPSRPQRVYLAVGGDGNPADGQPPTSTGRVLCSDDAGTTWRTSTQRWSINGNQSFRTGSESLAVDPDDPDHVVLGTARQGLWQSRDGGRSWAQVPLSTVPDGVVAPTSADQAGVGSVAFVGGDIVVGVANRGVYRAAKVTDQWERIRSIDVGTYPAGITDVDGAIWLAIDSTTDGQAIISRFDSATGQWVDTPLPARSTVANFAVDPANPTHIVAAGGAVRDDQLFTSADGGDTWIAHQIRIHSPSIPWLEQTDLASYMSVGRFVFDPRGGTLWFAEGMAVWTTDNVDAGIVQWTSNSVGMEEIVAAGVMAAPGAAPIGIAADRQGFRFSDITRYPARTLIDDRFAGGTSADYSGGHPKVMAWVGAEYNIYYSPDRRVEGAISRDGGVTWTRFSASDRGMFGGEIAVSATNPDDLVWLPTHFTDPYEYLRQPAGVYVSHDGGASWRHQATVDGIDSFHRFLWWLGRRALAADRVNGNFYLMSDQGAFYVSSDAGDTWQRAAHAPPCLETTACHVYGQVQAQPGAAEHLWAGVGSGGLFESVDAGRTTWHRIPGIDEVRSFAFGAAMAPGAAPTLFVYGKATGDTVNGLYRSTDSGRSWVSISRFPNDSFADVTGIAGDPTVAGRVYVAFNGIGFARGDPRS